MPELPEVETVVRTLVPRLEGRRIVAAKFFAARVHGGLAPPLAARTIRRVRRHGKLILFELDQGLLAVHLGMTGRLLFGGVPGPYTRALLTLDEGSVRFDDIRQFGSMRWKDKPPDNLGPDALALRFDEFAELLRDRRGAIKPLLLNQAFVSGIGNIYADEILFRARIHPLASVARLGKARVQRLHSAMAEVLTQAITSGGSSVSNYVDANGHKGSFQFQHQVYRKTGVPCAACGAPIRRILVAQRGTHYCARCQRA